MEEEEQLSDLATDVLLVSGRRKPQENHKKTTTHILWEMPQHEPCQQSLVSSAFRSGINL